MSDVGRVAELDDELEAYNTDRTTTVTIVSSSPLWFRSF